MQNTNNSNYRKFYDVIQKVNKKKKTILGDGVRKSVDSSETNQLLKQLFEF